MAPRKQQLSRETVNVAIVAIETSIAATDHDEIERSQELYDARRELMALSGDAIGADKQKPKRTYRRRGLPRDEVRDGEAGE